jgi:hypothetical protein
MHASTTTVLGAIDAGSTAWVLVSAALVLFMTPGLAFFYGGMVRAKHVLGMLMQNFFAMGIISVLWALIGFSLAFGGTGKYIGNLDFVGLKGLGDAATQIPGYVKVDEVVDLSLVIPPLLFVMFQMTFAIITPALITGATADRLKFSAYALFITFWFLLVYVPVARWVFSPNGWLFKMGALDFAGGAVDEDGAKSLCRPTRFPSRCWVRAFCGSVGLVSTQDQLWVLAAWLRKRSSTRTWLRRLLCVHGCWPRRSRVGTQPRWAQHLVQLPVLSPLPRVQASSVACPRWSLAVWPVSSAISVWP